MREDKKIREDKDTVFFRLDFNPIQKRISERLVDDYKVG